MKILTLCLGFLSLTTAAEAPPILFAPNKTTPKNVERAKEYYWKDPNYYWYRPDPAFVETYYPLTRAQRNSLSVDKLAGFDQEQLDQIYFRLGSGPIPTGVFRGKIMVRNEMVRTIENRAFDQFFRKRPDGRIFNKALLGALCLGRDRIECLGELIWKGKIFYPRDKSNSIQLRNFVSTRLTDAIGRFAMNKAGFGGVATALQSATIKRCTWMAYRMLLFPAHVYCGLSLIDTRKESIITDASHFDDFEAVKGFDDMIGRDGLNIRDEIRMVKPGLYLGRTYADKVFLLNFVLEQVAPVSPAADWPVNECWEGNSHL